MARGLAVGIVWAVMLACAAQSRPPDAAPAPVAQSAEPPPKAATAPNQPPETKDASFVPDTLAFFADGFAERFAERALISGDRPRSGARPVAERGQGRARIVIAEARYRVAGWIEDSALREVALESTPLAGSAKGKPGRVVVLPGALLERKAERDGWVQVVATDNAVEGFGWLPAERIGRIFTPAPPASTAQSDWVLAAGSKILDRPGGHAIAQRPKDAYGELLVRELKRVGWYVEIEYSSDALSLSGFVPRQALSEIEPHGYGYGYGRAGRNEPPTERVSFAAGTCLYDSTRKEVIGAVRLPLVMTVHVETGELAAWRRLDLGWGAPETWAPRGETAPENSGVDPEPMALGLDTFRCGATPAAP